MSAKKFPVTNTPMLAAALAKAQEGCAGCELDADTVCQAVFDGNEKLADLGISRFRQKGALLFVASHFQQRNSPFLVSYTQAALVRYASGWFVTEISREKGLFAFTAKLILTEEQRLSVPSIFFL